MWPRHKLQILSSAEDVRRRRWIGDAVGTTRVRLEGGMIRRCVLSHLLSNSTRVSCHTFIWTYPYDVPHSCFNSVLRFEQHADVSVVKAVGVWERSPYGGGPMNGGGGIRPYDYTSLKRPRTDGPMMAGPSMHSSPMMNNYVPPPPYEHTQAAAFELQQCRQMITELKRVRAGVFGTRACSTQIVTGESGRPTMSRYPPNVCRAQLQNRCQRGARCRFYHPPAPKEPTPPPREPSPQPKYTMDDFQGAKFEFCINYRRRDGCGLGAMCKLVSADPLLKHLFSQTCSRNPATIRIVSCHGTTGPVRSGTPTERLICHRQGEDGRLAGLHSRSRLILIMPSLDANFCMCYRITNKACASAVRPVAINTVARKWARRQSGRSATTQTAATIHVA
ncbi:unnamed protein product [Sphagnum balticum]